MLHGFERARVHSLDCSLLETSYPLSVDSYALRLQRRLDSARSRSEKVAQRSRIVRTKSSGAVAACCETNTHTSILPHPFGSPASVNAP